MRPLPRPRVLLTVVFVCANVVGLNCLPAASDIATLKVVPDIGQPQTFQRVEFTLAGIPNARNPFDPETIAVDAVVTNPDGKQVTIPAFYYQGYQRELNRKRETLTAAGSGQWRLRWLPTVVGRHLIAVTARVAGTTVGTGRFEIEAVAGTHRGIVQVEPTARRYFQTSDGTPLLLNGLCACWHDRRGTFDYDDWLPAYEKAGINYIRIWMWNHAFGIEWDRQDRVQYRMDNAWQLDRVLAEAERHGVYVMLCFDYHGIFEVKPDYWGGNNFWPRHPYNAANGGPCQTQNDFFTSDAAKKLYRKRLRYLVARWSAFPNLLAWEFFNEIDNEYRYLKHEDVMQWHREMSRTLRTLDPVKHLISSSFTGKSQRAGLYDMPEMDFAQYHSYNEPHPAQMTAERTASFHQKYHKPFFVSEYGTDWRGWKPEGDRHFRALHQAIWSGVFTGAAGTDMTWWWQQIHTNNLYSHWRALAEFLKGTGAARGTMAPAQWSDVDKQITAYGVAAPDEALIWFLDRAYDWPNGAKDEHPDSVAGAAATLLGLDNGSWHVEWWNTSSGKLVDTTAANVTDNTIRLTAPQFQVDIAARLRPAH